MKFLFFISSLLFGLIHPIKTTTSKLSFKKGEKAVYTIRFFKDDFDSSFKRIDMHFDAYDGLNDSEKKDVVDYLNENIELYIDGVKQQKLVLKKYTSEDLTITFTFETSVVNDFQRVKIVNTVFYDFFGEQQTNNIKFVLPNNKTFNAACVDTFPYAEADKAWFN